MVVKLLFMRNVMALLQQKWKRKSGFVDLAGEAFALGILMVVSIRHADANYAIILEEL